MANKRLFRLTVYAVDGRHVLTLNRREVNYWIQHFLTNGMTFGVESL